MSDQGFQGATVIADADHDGTEVLYVDVNFRLTDVPVNPSMVVGLTHIVREALRIVGETRYPIVRHHFDERQKVAGWR